MSASEDSQDEALANFELRFVLPLFKLPDGALSDHQRTLLQRAQEDISALVQKHAPIANNAPQLNNGSLTPATDDGPSTGDQPKKTDPKPEKIDRSSSQRRARVILQTLFAAGSPVDIDKLSDATAKAGLSAVSDGALRTQVNRLQKSKCIASPHRGLYEITESGQSHLKRLNAQFPSGAGAS